MMFPCYDILYVILKNNMITDENLMMYSYASKGHPPPQPKFPSCLVQSTRFCSESDTNLPEARACWPSRTPVVEKAQHEPQPPWSLTGVTTPFVLQSTDAGNALPEDLWVRATPERLKCPPVWKPMKLALTSSTVYWWQQLCLIMFKSNLAKFYLI